MAMPPSSTEPPTPETPDNDSAPTSADSADATPTAASAAAAVGVASRGRKWAAGAKFAGVSVLAGVVAAGLLLPFAGAAGVGAQSTIASYEDLPASLTTPPLPVRTVIRDKNGGQIAQLYKENRVEVPLSAISVYLQRAVIATEDARFYDHNGVDLKGTARALASTAGGEQVQGASTITMQYVKNVLITGAETQEGAAAAQARSAARKVQEVRYAVEVERRLTKSEILNNYLNISYFGAGAYGAEAAANRYFSTSAANLTLTQAATLAGLVQSPVKYDPTKNADAAMKRRNQVLGRMLETGAITKAQYTEAIARPVSDDLKPQNQNNGCAESTVPFYCDFVVRQILADPRWGKTPAEREKFLETGGLVIDTPLDPLAQNAAHEAAVDRVPAADESEKAVAVAMVQPGTGNVLALAQNKDWGTSGPGKTTFNYAVDANEGGTIGMQAGSTFKPFTLAAAIDSGIDPNERINATSPLWLDGGDWGCPGMSFGGFTGENSTQSGFFNMWEATAYSTNTYFLQRERDAGLCKTVEMARRAGIHRADGKPLEPNISFTLGTTEVSPLTLANSYATFAAHGNRCEPKAVNSITDRAGKTITVPSVCEQTIPRDVADSVTAVLTGVVDGPFEGRTGANMTLGRETTGKTGTTDSHAAVWFAGYTPEIATAVWTGDPRGGFKYPMQDVTINGEYYGEVFGSSLPGPIWQQAMLGALADTPASNFDLQAKYGMKSVQQGGGPAAGANGRNGQNGQYQPYQPYQQYPQNGNTGQFGGNGTTTP